jgi:hypothetical protein
LPLSGVVSHSWRRRTFQSARFDMWAAQLPDLVDSRKTNRAKNVIQPDAMRPIGPGEGNLRP